MFGTGIGLPELVVIFLVILLLFGAKSLPEIAKGLARGIKLFKKEAKEIQNNFDSDKQPSQGEAPARNTSNDFDVNQDRRDWRPDNESDQGKSVRMDKKDEPCVVSINISKGGIPKLPVDRINISTQGLEGDGHNHEKHYRPTQAVCIQDIERLDELCAKGYPLGPGAAGENLTVRDLDVNSLPVGTILKFSNVILEITRKRPTCYVMDQIHPKLKEDADSRHGMYAQVNQSGNISVGETIIVITPPEVS